MEVVELIDARKNLVVSLFLFFLFSLQFHNKDYTQVHTSAILYVKLTAYTVIRYLCQALNLFSSIVVYHTCFANLKICGIPALLS